MANLILVFGDSIAWGAYDKEYGGWVERLKLYFWDRGVFVYNLGIESQTSKDLLGRFENELKERIYGQSPSEFGYDLTIIFEIGKNDSIFNKTKNNCWVNVDDFRSNIKKLINLSMKYSSKIFFIGLAKVDETKTIPWEENGDSYCNENLEAYSDVIEKVCKENKVNFIAIKNNLNKEDLSDGLHPNAKGHEKIFKKVHDELNKLKIFN